MLVLEEQQHVQQVKSVHIVKIHILLLMDIAMQIMVVVMVKNVQFVVQRQAILLIIGAVGHILALLNTRELVQEVDVETRRGMEIIQEERQRVLQSQHVVRVAVLMVVH